MLTSIMRHFGNRWFTTVMCTRQFKPSEMVDIGGDPNYLIKVLVKHNLLETGDRKKISFNSRSRQQGVYCYRVTEKGHKYWIEEDPKKVKSLFD